MIPNNVAITRGLIFNMIARPEPINAVPVKYIQNKCQGTQDGT